MKAPKLTPGEWLKVANALTVEAEKFEEHAELAKAPWMPEHHRENLLDGAKERRAMVSRIITAMKENEK